MVAGIIACVLAVLGIIFLAIIFVPLAIVVAIIGSFIALKNLNIAGIGVNLLAWVLIVVGVVTSPVRILRTSPFGARTADIRVRRPSETFSLGHFLKATRRWARGEQSEITTKVRLI